MCAMLCEEFLQEVIDEPKLRESEEGIALHTRKPKDGEAVATFADGCRGREGDLQAAGGDGGMHECAEPQPGADTAPLRSRRFCWSMDFQPRRNVG